MFNFKIKLEVKIHLKEKQVILGCVWSRVGINSPTQKQELVISHSM